MKRKQFWKRICSSFLCITLIISCLPQIPIIAYAESVMENEKEVKTEAEFISALRDESIEVIKLMTDITLSRSDDGMDNLFVIPRSVTIRGGGLTVERAGLILGGAVTFEGTNIYFSNSVRNAIIANGYPLTLDTVSNNGSSRDIDIFCGGITDYNGGNPEEIPAAGIDAIITIKGTNRFTNDSTDGKGGDIYAGSLSDLGCGLTDKANAYNGNATIVIEDGAKGIGKIYGHGARENREGGFPNDWKPSSSLYKVLGAVTISLKGTATISVDGATGGETNAVFVYTDSAYGNMCSPMLKNISSIILEPSVEKIKPHLAPVITDADSCNFTQLVVPENTRLSLVNMQEMISASTFIGGGELVFKEGNQTLQVKGKASGRTTIAIGEIGFDGLSTGKIQEDFTYIFVDEVIETCDFTLLPVRGSNMKLEHDGEGNWKTKLELADTIIKSISSIEDFTIQESAISGDLIIEIDEVIYASLDEELNYLCEVPMTIFINGKELYREYDYGYVYVTGETAEDIRVFFYPDEKEGLYIQHYDYVNQQVPNGRYEISIVIPDAYMEDKNPHTLEFVLTVACDEHTGGTATCKEKAVCTICGEVYGELDLDCHTGGIATCKEKAECERCGTAYGDLNPNNHAGGTELRGVKEATENETGYTGDTYCLGCNMKILDGEVIPKKEVEKISVTFASITLLEENFTYDGKEKKPVITVSVGNKRLTENTDYTIRYENNKNAGTARVIITGIGKYEGEQIKTFKIHTGGTASCTEKAVCTICGEAYGELDLNRHTGGIATCKEKAKCERCGTAYGDLNPNNHAGGTELHGVKEATEEETGYTGDTYCLGCKVKIVSGKEIPKLPKQEEPTPPEPEKPVDPEPEEGVKKGDKFNSGKYKYIVTSSKTVAFNGIVSNSTKKITIPETVTYRGIKFKVTSIADNALKGKKLITSVTISDNVTKIGQNAFYGCKKLKTITINTQKLSKVGSNVLKGIYAKATIKVPTKKYSAYQKLFQKKGQGKNVSIVILAKKGDTFSVSNNKYKIIGSSSVEFTGLVNTKKKEVIIPKTVKYGGKSFQVTVIAEKALKGNTKVKKITIGENLKEIKANAFYGCRKLKTIQIKSTKLKVVGKNACKGIYSKATIKVPKNKWKKYKELFKNKGQGSKVQISK